MRDLAIERKRSESRMKRIEANMADLEIELLQLDAVEAQSDQDALVR